MPEIVDLEVSRKNMLTRVKGKILQNFEIGAPIVLRNTDPRTAVKLLSGKKLTDITRVSKSLRFEFEDVSLAVHLMLHGDFKWGDRTDSKGAVCSLDFGANDTVLITDWSRWVRLELHSSVHSIISEALTKEYGVDPLSDAFDPPAVEGILKKNPRSIIKSVLMNQSIVSGIGNAYADEILWHAKIHPQSRCGALYNAGEAGTMYRSIRDVIRNALETVMELSKGEDISEQPRSFMKVYRKSGMPCPACGYMVACTKIASRDTFICEKCQRKF